MSVSRIYVVEESLEKQFTKVDGDTVVTSLVRRREDNHELQHLLDVAVDYDEVIIVGFLLNLEPPMITDLLEMEKKVIIINGFWDEVNASTFASLHDIQDDTPINSVVGYYLTSEKNIFKEMKKWVGGDEEQWDLVKPWYSEVEHRNNDDEIYLTTSIFSNLERKHFPETHNLEKESES